MNAIKWDKSGWRRCSGHRLGIGNENGNLTFKWNVRD